MASATLDLRLPSQPPRDRYQIIRCLVTNAHVCKQLAHGCYLKAKRREIEPATFSVANLTPEPLHHQATSSRHAKLTGADLGG